MKAAIISFCLLLFSTISWIKGTVSIYPSSSSSSFLPLPSSPSLLPLVSVPAAVLWAVSDARAACHGQQRTCRRLTCGAVADRRSRSVEESHRGLKIEHRRRRERSWRRLLRERNRNVGVIFTSCVSLLHPRRDLFSVKKTFTPFF